MDLRWLHKNCYEIAVFEQFRLEGFKDIIEGCIQRKATLLYGACLVPNLQPSGHEQVCKQSDHFRFRTEGASKKFWNGKALIEH